MKHNHTATFWNYYLHLITKLQPEYFKIRSVATFNNKSGHFKFVKMPL